MARYGKTASKSVSRTMSKRKRGTLKSGSGKKVTSRKQAIAIGLSEARKKGGKVPRKRTARTTSRKRTARTTSRKRTTRSSSTTRRKAA